VTAEQQTGALAALGWDASLDAAFAPLASDGWEPARVVAEHRNAYVIATADGDRSAVLAGRLRHQTHARDELPAVGDWVAVAGAEDGGEASIRAVLPRRSAFRRKVAGDVTAAQVVAANVDVVLVATALDGDLNARRLERYLALAWESGATPLVALTKADLCEDRPGALSAVQAAAPGVDVVVLSATTGEGVDALEAYLRSGRTAVLLGSSGVGKSTLVNRLSGGDRLRTAPVREDGRGRHTTTHRELVRLASGALLIDTPGMRELQLWSADAGLDAAFSDVEALAAGCRFRDCRHDSEPGCAVRAAAAAGSLDGERLAHWRKLRRELEYLDRKQADAAAAAERARSKVVHRALRAHLRRKYR
jgi:ribosome biogenesis GTPase